jgi:hypothetical protein
VESNAGSPGAGERRARAGLSALLRRPLESQLLAAGLVVAAVVLLLEGKGMLAVVCFAVAIPAYVWAYEVGAVIRERRVLPASDPRLERRGLSAGGQWSKTAQCRQGPGPATRRS